MSANTATRPKVVVPDDFEDEGSFLKEMRQLWEDDVNFDRLNREAGLEDLKFLVGEQWDDVVRQRREKGRKPVLTVNRLPAFVSQIVGNRRLNETQIKVLPDNGGTESIARVREGLMRNIQKVSKADRAFDKALECQVACGIGNFMVALEYEDDDVFVQKISVKEIPDAYAAVWDRTLVEPTGADAGHAFLEETLTSKDFKRRWPWAVPAEISVDTTTRTSLRASGWISTQDVRIVNFYRMRTKPRTLALMDDGSTKDVTDETDETYLQNVVQDPETGAPVMRQVDRKYCEMYVCSGTNILEGPYRLPIKRVPLFRVPGWEINIGQEKHRFGLIRFLKDPQKLHNYWRSVIAEKLMQSPRAVWKATDTAVQGREQEWRESHLSDDPLLIYNGEAGTAPERVPPSEIEEALLQQAEITNQDIKDVSNIHEANLGMPSNEVSGAAITARQRVSDTGTVLYHDNLALAIEQCGQVINDLIPVVYDTLRIVKVLGVDAKEDMQIINEDGNPDSVDITAGKYSVTVSTGPSLATKRIEATQSMMAFINAAPQVAGYTLDLIAEAMDWPKHEEFARRIRLTLPAGMIDPKDMTPDLQQKAESAAQQQQKQEQMQDAAFAANLAEKNSTAALNAARAHSFVVNADNESSRVQTEALGEASQAAHRELQGRLEAIKTGAGD